MSEFPLVERLRVKAAQDYETPMERAACIETEAADEIASLRFDLNLRLDDVRVRDERIAELDTLVDGLERSVKAAESRLGAVRERAEAWTQPQCDPASRYYGNKLLTLLSAPAVEGRGPDKCYNGNHLHNTADGLTTCVHCGISWQSVVEWRGPTCDHIWTDTTAGKQCRLCGLYSVFVPAGVVESQCPHKYDINGKCFRCGEPSSIVSEERMP